MTRPHRPEERRYVPRDRCPGDQETETAGRVQPALTRSGPSTSAGCTRTGAAWRATTPKPSAGSDAPPNRETPPVQYNLGFMYANGRGVQRDDAEAVRWYRHAAEQGNATGQYSLGFMYANGRGVARDDAEAVRWYRRAAEQGNATGQYNLGSCTRTGAAGVVIAWKPYAGTAWPPNRGMRSCRRRSTACGETSGLGPIFGTIHQGIDLDTTAGLSPDHALALLERQVAAGPATADPPALVIFPTVLGEYVLAYRAVRTVDQTEARRDHVLAVRLGPAA